MWIETKVKRTTWLGPSQLRQLAQYVEYAYGNRPLAREIRAEAKEGGDYFVNLQAFEDLKRICGVKKGELDPDNFDFTVHKSHKGD